MFSYPLLQGDPSTVLDNPGSVVISESMARRYFGSENPMDKILEVNGWVDGSYTVTGVYQDLPANSHLQFDFLFPMEDLLLADQYQEDDGWDWYNFITYVQLRPSAEADVVADKMTDIIMHRRAEELLARNAAVRFALQPVTDIHLYSEFSTYNVVQGSYRTVYFFTIIAFFILIIAWVNYVNLATARALERAREVGVRKVAGARKSQLVTQFLFEPVLTNFVALVIAVGLSFLFLPYLNQLANTGVTTAIWKNGWFWLAFTGVFGGGTVLAGLYPAFFLSSFKPISVLKSRTGKTGSRLVLRKVLVVFQFVASVALLTGTYVVYNQVTFMRNVDLGINLDQILVVAGPRLMDEGVDTAELTGSFKDELSRHPFIGDIASSNTVPGEGFDWYTRIRKESAEPADSEDGRITWIDYEFVDMYEMKFVEGRNFSEDFTTDETEAVIINESAARNLGFDTNEEALTENVIIGGEEPIQVIGVLKDFNWMSVHREADPAVLYLTQAGSEISFKVRAENIRETVETVRATYETFFPGNPFDYFFLDDAFNEQYKSDEQFATLFGVFAIFATFVACLGLMGLTAFSARQRTKEIGVRKVLGASSVTILRLLVFDFVKLVAVAIVLTVPIMYFALQRWLEDFASRIDLSVGLFLIPGLIVLAIAVLTVSYHTTVIAVANPVQSLRYE